MTQTTTVGTVTVGDVYSLGRVTVGDVYSLGTLAFDESRALSYLDYITSLGLTTELQTHLQLDELDPLEPATDYSGNGNDGTYQGVTLGQPPIVEGFEYSVLGPGYITAPYTMADPALHDITARFDFKTSGPISTNTGLFGRLANPQRFEVYFIAGGQIRFDVYDGSPTGLARITTAATYDDGLPRSICIRQDNASLEIEMWIDGVSVGTASTAGTTLTPGTTTDFRFNSSYIAGPGVNYHGGPTLWRASLSDTDCALMSAGVPI